MTKKHTKNQISKKNKHPHHKKVPHSRNFRAMWVIGLIIFIVGIIIDNAWVIIPGGILAIYGIMNRHLWHIHYK